MENKRITLDDFKLDEYLEDDIFMEVSGGATESAVVSCAISVSVAVSLASLLSASSPANTYTELGCC